MPGIAGQWISFSVFMLPLHLLMAITGSFMVLRFSLLFSQLKVLGFIGENSLVYYLTHAIILGLMVRIVSTYLINPQNKIEALCFNCIVFFGTIIICSIFAKLFKREAFSWLVKMPINKKNR